MIIAQWIRGRNGDIMLCVSCWDVSDSLWPYGLSPQKNELPRLVGAWYATGEEWRNSSRKNEEMEPKFSFCPVVDVTSDESEVQGCKEHRNLEC